MIRLADDASVLYCDICGEGFPAYSADLAGLRAIEQEHGECDEDAELPNYDDETPPIGACRVIDVDVEADLWRYCMRECGHTGGHSWGDWQ